MQLMTRGFARNVAYASMGKQPEYVTPTPAEEFDAHRYRMEGKHDDIQNHKWYELSRGRNIFRLDPQFPERNLEYRTTFVAHEKDLFENQQKRKIKEHEQRWKDNLRIISRREKILRNMNRNSGSNADKPTIEETAKLLSKF